MKVPLVCAQKLWHLGSMNPALAAGGSQEGNLLSVSACPEAWSTICKLGGREIFESDKPLRLLDMRELLYGKQHDRLRKEIEAFGLARGLAERKRVFRVSWFDDELDDTLSCVYGTREQAEAEADDPEDISEEQMLVCTENLAKLHGQDVRQIFNAMGFLSIEWSREVLGKRVDGVYWTEEYAPLNYSSPRGGLFPHAIQCMKQVESYPDDEDGLEGITVAKSLRLESGLALG
ncbi:hypothetical protein ACYPKM_01580 [Pseudomonas aeruginosa]